MKQWRSMAAILLAGIALAGCGENGNKVSKEERKGKKPKVLIVCSTECGSGPVMETAKHIRDRTDGDLLHIHSCGGNVSAGLPCIMPPLSSLDGYDALFFGVPAWSFSAGPSLEMFLASCSTGGQTLFPFLTDSTGNAPSYLKKLKKNLPAHATAPALIVRRSSVQDVFPGRAPHRKRSDLKTEVDAWLDRLETDGWL